MLLPPLFFFCLLKEKKRKEFHHKSAHIQQKQSAICLNHPCSIWGAEELAGWQRQLTQLHNRLRFGNAANN